VPVKARIYSRIIRLFELLRVSAAKELSMREPEEAHRSPASGETRASSSLRSGIVSPLATPEEFIKQLEPKSSTSQFSDINKSLSSPSNCLSKGLLYIFIVITL
jgi:hypothetical protein